MPKSEILGFPHHGHYSLKVIAEELKETKATQPAVFYTRLFWQNSLAADFKPENMYTLRRPALVATVPFED
jgi:hypothetical protein